MKIPTTVLLLFISQLVVSCEGPSEYLSKSASGNMVYERRWGQVGGTRSNSRSDGSSEANDYQKSLQDMATMGTGIAIGWHDVKIKNSDNALTGLQNTNARKLGETTIKADTALGIGAQKPVITTPPQIFNGFPPRR